MIEDARVLEDEFIPREVEHRHEAVNRLSSALEPCIDGDRAENALLFGATGAGKTCIAKYTVNQLKEILVDLNHQYVNCWQDYNRYRILYRLLEGLGRASDIRRQSTPKDELLERLRPEPDSPFIVVLDEADQIQDTEVLYDLYRIPYITMILIANKETELFFYLDDRVASRLQGSVRIHFDTYTVDELVSILDTRVQWGLVEDAISRKHLELIADHAAGDARIAISLLKSAARLAERERLDEITADVINRAIPDAEQDVNQSAIEKFNEHQQTLYEIIEEYEEIEPQPLYTEYEDRATDPVTKRTLRKYLQKLDHYNLIDASGEGRGRTYRIIE